MEKGPSSAPSTVVALTGSTGNFGSYLLDRLLTKPEVKKVVCLNRSRDARSRQLKQNGERGLATDFAKVEFVQADFGVANWGLGQAAMETILEEVNVVIHNAWPVDFNRSFASFSLHIDGVRHLIELSRRRHVRNATKQLEDSPDASSNESLDNSMRSKRTARNDAINIFFISSIGIVSNWGSYAPTSRQNVPEDELTDWKLARTGYGQSKLLAERLLAYAALRLGVPVTIVRVGQLAGPVLRDTRGAWPTQEWFPSLIKSSKTLRVVPADLGPLDNVDFVPVDLAAQITLELMRLEKLNSATSVCKKRTGGDFYHIVNPKIVPWSEMLQVVLKSFPQDMKVVSLVDWVDKLKASAGKAGTSVAFQSVDEGDNPALKLFDSFDYMQDRAIRFPGARAAVLATKRTAGKSPTLAALHAVSGEWMELWMKQWNF